MCNAPERCLKIELPPASTPAPGVGEEGKLSLASARTPGKRLLEGVGEPLPGTSATPKRT